MGKHRGWVQRVIIVAIYVLIGGQALAIGTGSEIVVYAWGDVGGERMQLHIDGELATEWTVTRTNSAYSFTHHSYIGNAQLEVHFVNNTDSRPGSDLNLNVAKVVVDGKTYQTADPGVYGIGIWSNGSCRTYANHQQEKLACDGYFNYTIENSSTITVHAYGDYGGEKIELRIDGVAVADWEVTPTNSPYAYAHDSKVSIDQVQVHFTNDGDSLKIGADLNLNVDRVVIDGQEFETEAASTLGVGVWNPTTGCSDYVSHESEKLSCNGYFQYANNLGLPENPPSTPDPEPVPESDLGSAGFDPRSYNWAANTGHSGTLTRHNGAYYASTAGMVIENLEISGGLFVYADNVTVKNCWIYNTKNTGTNNNAAYYTVRVVNGSLTIEDSTIGHANYTAERGLAGDSVTAKNVEITHHFDGIKIGSNSTYEYVYVHDLSTTTVNPHADAVQNNGGAVNWTITRSYLSSVIAADSPQKAGDAGNAAALIKSDLGPISNWEISESLFSGGNYQIYVVSDNKDVYGCPSNGALINNYFTDNSVYGPLSTTNFTAATDCQTTTTFSDNRWEDTGEPIVF